VTPFVFNTTPSIRFGSGAAVTAAADVVARLGTRLLLVTDRGLVTSGLLGPIVAALSEAGASIDLFADVVADPPEHVVLAAAATAREAGATGVLAIGGGSPMDVAKLAALLARSGEELAAIYGVGLAKGPRLPLALVPTTAGTGSEVTPIAIVTTGAAEKKGVVSPVILPDLAILDPELTLLLPAAVTAATGVDAMVHAIEAFTSASPNNNPVSKALAREALALLGANIVRAVRDGQDRAARGAMLLGSLLAGQAFANAPVAAVHALAYPLGGHFHIPHGLSNALVLPEVVRFNAPVVGEAYAELARLVFAEGPRAGTPLADALAGLSAEIGLPPRLRDVGVPEAALDLLADDAMKQTRLLVNNPRPLTREDARAISARAW
jgi:alcohol dehydrogenase class IV